MRKLTKALYKMLGIEKISVIKLKDGHLTFENDVHGSVGLWFDVKCNKSAFEVWRGLSYKDPQRAHLSGGDGAKLFYELTPKRRGLFLVTEVITFRRDWAKTTRHLLFVI